ncbi:MAG: DUF1738 domain-containing protein [Firmicutes bacterium]|nr:DUF1738 domain-containing protein [Bacillota bacterium]
MSRPKNKDEYRQEMAEAFAHVLEEKGLEWRKEWTGTGGSAPHNGITKACYRGSNAFWLSLVAMMKGYSDPRWVTMVQIMDKDSKYHPKEKWHLKAGSKATYVEYWYPFDLKDKKALTWDQYKQEIQSGRREDEFKLSTRYTAVFNACNVEGMPEISQEPENTNIHMDEMVQKLSEGMGVQILLDGGDQAYYSPHQDQIHLPTPSSFENEYAFNATALHELSHSTGHPSRLNRPMSGFFGTSQYAYEELVAEMCSCFMGFDLHAEASANHIDNHKAYVQSWIQAIREKPETLIKAIKDAQAAANYMDWKAGLITDKEYELAKSSVMEVRQKEREKER